MMPILILNSLLAWLKYGSSFSIASHICSSSTSLICNWFLWVAHMLVVTWVYCVSLSNITFTEPHIYKTWYTTSSLYVFISEVSYQLTWSRTHSSSSTTSGSFSKLNTERDRMSVHKSVLNRPDQKFLVAIGRHDGMQARCFGRELIVSPGSRDLVLSDYDRNAQVEVVYRGG